ncbi:MAG: hypothetical protein AVDCRST_MAG68-1355 [uncultured Gemmatimonadetes bacterium]|uniref:Uncharacterized protein n=1 Tax=uncultured Gemmatimonadota bacterium TaxID=203437 RepID=A0A6J4KRE4_9BACT|nr:MAG: hypothetical protein AVDCRST_MAG68-1355 [uncultured Gemmatimonadota bacterium]
MRGLKWRIDGFDTLQSACESHPPASVTIHLGCTLLGH